MTKPANGHAATNTLVAVQGNIELETATAAAYLRAKAAGGLTISPPLGGYRSYADQAALKANPAAYGSSLKSSQIAPPGNSTHGYGDCVDISAGNAWFQTHCGTYGFVRESPAGENNHYRFLHPTWAVAGPAVNRTTIVATNDREYADTKAPIKRVVPKGTSIYVAGYIRSLEANGISAGSNIWFYIPGDGYFHSSCFNVPTTVGLTDYTSSYTVHNPIVAKPPVVTPPVVTPPVVTPPVTEPVVTPPVVDDPPPVDPIPPITTTPVTTTPATGATPVAPPTTEPLKPTANWFTIIWNAILIFFGGKPS